ncbi:MAG: class II aldolase/adducin family protein [Ideonella sp. WA131b]|nr:class II aldolase/adducin family protein [Ideonella sp. WA131b]
MSADEARRAELVATVRRLDAHGLNRGSTGNASVRDAAGQGVWITPTGMGAEVEPDDLVWLSLDGAQVRGRWQPSSEWHFHLAAHRARPGRQAVLHTHSPHATALACLRRPLPPFHYMVAIAGGHEVPLVPYHLFGTEALSQGVGAALAEVDACLLANHGLIAAGSSLAQAEKVLTEIEALCGVYLQAMAVGEPALLSPADMAEVQERFRDYGRARRS